MASPSKCFAHWMLTYLMTAHDFYAHHPPQPRCTPVDTAAMSRDVTIYTRRSCRPRLCMPYIYASTVIHFLALYLSFPMLVEFDRQSILDCKLGPCFTLGLSFFSHSPTLSFPVFSLPAIRVGGLAWWEQGHDVTTERLNDRDTKAETPPSPSNSAAWPAGPPEVADFPPFSLSGNGDGEKVRYEDTMYMAGGDVGMDGLFSRSRMTKIYDALGPMCDW